MKAPKRSIAPNASDVARKQQEISKFKGESKSYSLARPKRKVLSRYAR